MYLRLDTPVLLNADGWRLFDAAVLWGAGRLGQDAAACVGIAEGGDCATGPNECDEGICQAGKCVPPPGQSPTCQVEPQLTCVIPNPTSGADYTAVFGYTNRRPQNVYAPAAATDNFVMRPGVDTSAARWFDVGQPGWFKGATASQPNQPAAFTVDFNTGDEVSWTLGNRSPVFASADWAAVRQCTVNPNGPDGPVVVIGGKEYPVGLDPKKIIDHGSVPTDVLPDPSNPPGFAAGTTVGSLNVTTDGMATYSIPIQVPAGRRGIQPQISLSYRSRGGNGLPGVGWTIAGLSDIEVCPTNLRLDRSFSTGQPENRPITFNGTDPMCLDGSRLIETTSLVVGSDAYLKAVVPQDREYRTERTDGSRVIARGPSGGGIPLYFEVGTRDGRVLTYGIGPSYVSTHDSHKVLGKPLRVAQMAAAQQVVAAAWPLTQVRDRFGNRMDILYEVDADHTLVNSVDTWYEKERRPKEILYTGFGTEVGPRAVKFEYAMNARAPEDQLNLWFAGTNRRMTKLLTRIETYAPEISSTGTVAGSRLIRFYKLTHSKSPATGRMRLGTASECEPGPTSAPGDDACLKGVVFDYERGESDFEVIDVPEATDVFTAGAETDHGSLSTADLDGDGRADIIYAFKDGNARKHHYWLSNADKYGAPGENAFKLDGIIDSSQGYKNEARNLNVWTADLDGDGRAEIFVPASEDLKPTVETFNPLFTYLPYRVTSSGLTPFSPTELPGAPVRPFPGLGTRVAVAEPRELSSLFVIPSTAGVREGLGWRSSGHCPRRRQPSRGGVKASSARATGATTTSTRRPGAPPIWPTERTTSSATSARTRTTLRRPVTQSKGPSPARQSAGTWSTRHTVFSPVQEPAARAAASMTAPTSSTRTPLGRAPSSGTTAAT
jgi:hypothetical protein